MVTKTVKSKVFCPKCNCKDLYLIEIWQGHTIEWEQLNGKLDRNDGVLEHGSPYRLEGKCKNCQHTWKVKKATSIDDALI